MKTRTIGVSEARKRFSELLEQVAQGTEFVITKHELPVAKLGPVGKPARGALTKLFRQMDEFRGTHPLNRRD